jgi:glutamate-1-semialdehyde 2,1-aminomutase
MIAQGIFLHPHHNWFLCAAHTKDDIDEVLEKAGLAFRKAKKKASPQRTGLPG